MSSPTDVRTQYGARTSRRLIRSPTSTHSKMICYRHSTGENWRRRGVTITNMKVTIIIKDIERTYQGDYDVLHNRDWNELVRDLLDYAKDN